MSLSLRIVWIAPPTASLALSHRPLFSSCIAVISSSTALRASTYFVGEVLDERLSCLLSTDRLELVELRLELLRGLRADLRAESLGCESTNVP